MHKNDVFVDYMYIYTIHKNDVFVDYMYIYARYKNDVFVDYMYIYARYKNAFLYYRLTYLYFTQISSKMAWTITFI